MRNVIEILEELLPGVDFEKCDSLIDDGIIDSFDLVSLIGEINDEYGITVPMWEIVPKNFNSVEAINQLIERLRK